MNFYLLLLFWSIPISKIPHSTTLQDYYLLIFADPPA